MINCLTVERFHGDTFENFLKCSGIDNKGKVFFDKRKEPKFLGKETYADKSIAVAFSWALDRGLSLSHTPIIFSGRFFVFSEYVVASSMLVSDQFMLPEGVTFPVEKIWLPKATLNWREIDLWQKPDWIRWDKEVLDRLQLFDPTLFIR